MMLFAFSAAQAREIADPASRRRLRPRRPSSASSASSAPLSGLGGIALVSELSRKLGRRGGLAQDWGRAPGGVRAQDGGLAPVVGRLPRVGRARRVVSGARRVRYGVRHVGLAVRVGHPVLVCTAASWCDLVQRVAGCRGLTVVSAVMPIPGNAHQRTGCRS